MVLVQPAVGHVWLGAAGNRSAGLGLLRMERGPAESQRLVHAQIADVLPGGGYSAAAALVDSGGPASLAILRYDQPAPGRANPAGLGRVAGADDDRGRLVADVLSKRLAPRIPLLSSNNPL